MYLLQHKVDNQEKIHLMLVRITLIKPECFIYSEIEDTYKYIVSHSFLITVCIMYKRFMAMKNVFELFNKILSHTTDNRWPEKEIDKPTPSSKPITFLQK